MAQDRSNPKKYQRSDPLNPKKRGRPAKSANTEDEGFAVFTDKRGDKEIIQQVTERFEGLELFAEDIGRGKMRSVIISGAPGIGKTYKLLEVLNRMNANGQTTFHRTAGYVSTIEMYRMLFEYRHAGNVIMFDDTDNVFYDDNSLNILKAALDSIPQRVISYRTKSTVDVGEDDDLDDWDVDERGLPAEFEFNGTCIFVTNVDFYAYLDGPKTRVTPHVEALLNRTQYLDMCLHNSRAIALWIQHMVNDQKMLLKPEHGLTKEQSDAVLSFIVTHYKDIHRPSLRTAVGIADLVRNHPDRWEVLARMTKIKPKV